MLKTQFLFERNIIYIGFTLGIKYWLHWEHSTSTAQHPPFFFCLVFLPMYPGVLLFRMKLIMNWFRSRDQIFMALYTRYLLDFHLWKEILRKELQTYFWQKGKN